MFRKGFLPVLALASAAACSDSPTPPVTDTPTPVQDVVPSQIADVRAVDIDLPPEPRPWDTSAVALEGAIAAQDGHAVVGFKAPDSPRSIMTGRREAVPATAIQDGLDLLDQQGVTVLEYFWLIGGAHVQLPPGSVSALREDPLIDYIEPRQQWRVQGVAALLEAIAASPVLRQTAQTTPWGISMVRAPEAWSVATGSGATIQIIDTGHDRGHEDLPLVPLGNCAGPYDGCSDGIEPHGTHVSGIFTARDNSSGVVGVSPGVAASDVYMYAACNPDPPHGCDTNAIISGIQASIWFDVLSMSLGGTNYSQDMANAVVQAWNEGVVIVAGAGNRQEGSTPPANFYPAAFTNVIGVSGVRNDGTFADSSPCPHPSGGTVASNYGSYVDIAGPHWALSTVTNNGYEDETDGWCGTSMATPHVAGAAALLRQQNPGWSNQQIVDRLLTTAVPNCGGDLCGSGILDAASAVGIIEVSISGPTTIKQAGNYQWSCNASGGVGGYSYLWERSNDGGPFNVVGSSSVYSSWVDRGPPFSIDLRCTVTSGTEMESDTHDVAVLIP